MTDMNQPPPPPPPPAEPTPPPPNQPVGYETPTSGVSGYAGPAPDKDAKTMAMLCHLLSIFTWFIGPLVIWLVKKDSSPFVDDQGKEALNFQITVSLAHLVAGLLWLVCIGMVLTPAIGLATIVLAIMGTVAANNGVAYRYPLNIRFIK